MAGMNTVGSHLRGQARWALAGGLAMLLSLGTAACSDDESSPATGGTGVGAAGGSGGVAAGGGAAGGAGGSGGVAPACAVLVEGTNTGFVVDGLERTFILNLPDGVETGGPWPVVFNWHGLGDSAQNMSFMVSGQVNNQAFPFIGVTPEDTDHVVMGFSLDWDTFQVDGGTNKEARLFDEVLACLDARFGIDADHVHSIGFSLGGIVTDMLGVTRGDRLASSVSFSGAYFSNPDNVAALGALSGQVSWPEPSHGNPYAQMLIHGGASDTYPMGVVTLHFDQLAASDQGYLNAAGHDVILCNHDEGHTAPAPGMMPTELVQFFGDHPRGTTDSPYASGLPAGFSADCQLFP